MTAYLEKDYSRAHAYFAESLRLAQEAAAIATAVRTGVAVAAAGGGGGGESNPANKEMPMDEYLHVQCRLGMDLASSRIK